MPVTHTDASLDHPQDWSCTEADRRALIRAFTAWTRDPIAADDLAQETLFEAWRSTRRPESTAEQQPWLFGIARNVLRRWQRSAAQHSLRTCAIPETDDQLQLSGTASGLDELLERPDIVDVLDLALARIPAETRQALILKYVDELPQKEIAAKLGLHEKALEGKLHRGKDAIRTYFLTEATDLAVAQGLLKANDLWVTTRLWCPACGKRRLEGLWGDDGSLMLDCPACDHPITKGWRSEITRSGVMAAGRNLRSRYKARSFGAAWRSVVDTSYVQTRDGIYTVAECPICGGPTRVLRVDVSVISPAPELDVRCTRCGAQVNYGWTPGQTSSHPIAKRWLARGPRTRLLLPFVVERDGRETLVFEWNDMANGGELVIFRDRETLEYREILIDGVRVHE